jgi:ABC-2 type transport system permease protein
MAADRAGIALRPFLAMAGFELRQHLRSWLFWATAAVFAFLAFRYLATGIGDEQLGSVHRNSPQAITGGLIFFSMVGVFVSTAFVAAAAVRDRELRIQELFLSAPVSRGDYLAGRFVGSFLAGVLIFVPVLLAMMAGAAGPWVDPDRLGPFIMAAYLAAFAIFIVPNLFVMSALSFGLATLTRSLVWTYVGLVGLFLAWVVAGQLASPQLGALLDPFAYRTLSYTTRFWTTAELNTRIVGPEGFVLWNRVLWLGIALATLGATWLRFRSRAVTAGVTRAVPRRRPGRGPVAGRAGPAPRPPVTGRAGPAAEMARLRSQVTLETRQTLWSLPFLVILVVGVLAVVVLSPGIQAQWGTATHPLTRTMVERIQDGFYLFVFLLVTVFAGEAVWRDRQTGMADVVDCTPSRDPVLWGGKLLALGTALAVVLGVGILTGMAMQLAQGHTALEPGLYATGVLLELGLPALQVAVLALFLQALVNHKYLAYGLMLLFFLSPMALNAIGLSHPLYLFSRTPPIEYSGMNGYGHFVAPLAWFSLYWSFAAAVLVGLIAVTWVRGRETGARARLARARARLSRPTRGLLHVGLAGLVLTGGWIYFNTNVLNEHGSVGEAQERQARYEREYGQYAAVAQPRIASVDAEVDIYPETRALSIRGRYRLENRSGEPQGFVHVSLPPGVQDVRLVLPGRLVHDDAELGYRIYHLDRALEPGGGLGLEFEVRVENRGFVAGRSDTRLVANGSYFDHRDFFPHIGYDRWRELMDPVARRRRGLSPSRMAPLEQGSARANHVMSSQADWVEVESVVSTSLDQRAIGTGTLLREWVEGDRRFFHYRTEAPIPAFWAYLSGAWAVTRDRWNDRVDIEVYHHPDHDYNVGIMVDAAKRSLDYLTTHLSAYPLSELRIVQVHRLAGLAFPGKIVASEEAGFTARLSRPRDLALAYLGIAHEVAHQWWAYQAVGAHQEGAMLIMETLAQYAALMVVEDALGPLRSRELLRRDLDRYLQGRGMARAEEVPLLRVEDHRTVRYAKGGIVMYWVRELLGEDRLNGALREYLHRVAYQGPPYTTAAELLAAIREVTPEEHHPLLVDLFETITLWDLRATTAAAEPRPDGRWDVRLVVSASKVRSDGQGNETPAEMDDVVEIGVFGAPADGSPPEGRVLHLERVRLATGTHVLELVVDDEPRRAGIDPFNRLIDRNPGNNVVAVTR